MQHLQPLGTGRDQHRDNQGETDPDRSIGPRRTVSKIVIYEIPRRSARLWSTTRVVDVRGDKRIYHEPE